MLLLGERGSCGDILLSGSSMHGSAKENWNEISLCQSNAGFMKRTTAESCRLLVVTGNTVPGGLYLCRRGSTVLEFENA